MQRCSEQGGQILQLGCRDPGLMTEQIWLREGLLCVATAVCSQQFFPRYMSYDCCIHGLLLS